VLAVHREKLMLLGLLSSTVNHEIRNPLVILKALAAKVDALLSAGAQGEAVAKEVQKMDAQIERMITIVRRLSEFARPEQHSGFHERVDVSKALGDALFFASEELAYRKIEVHQQIAEALPPLVADKNQLEEIFLNLIVNACHAMREGGTLTLAANRTDQWLTVKVEDTGRGIAKADLKRIFKPFYTTKVKEGTGLGLYIVKTLVERNAGRIKVDSAPGRGTTFILEFPLRQLSPQRDRSYSIQS
jgi:two-component system NtrC family sensor kinase